MAFKIVDTFNGQESEERYTSTAEASRANEERREEFYENHTEDVQYCCVVAYEDAVWEWVERLSKYEWRRYVDKGNEYKLKSAFPEEQSFNRQHFRTRKTF